MYSSRSRSAPAPFYETVKQDICKKIAGGVAQRRAWRRGLAGKSRTGGVNLSSGKHYPHKEGFTHVFIPLPFCACAFLRNGETGHL
ncbi:hypothetical protein A9Y87_15270 [Salmonella enterica subsp. enterica]|nr:hypothetical protein A9Y87_15270 [Salmonella enterica subsp. enterica]